MKEAFTTSRFKSQPNRKTLSDTFAILAATGHLNAKQAQWLADNKANPNHLWLAASALTPKAAEDHQGIIESSALPSIIQSLPLRAVVRFVTRWQQHLPHCVPDTLVALLHNLCCRTETATFKQWERASELIQTLIENIAQALNKRLAHIEDENAPELPLAIGFIEHLAHDFTLMIGGDCMEGIGLNLNRDDLNDQYWEATKSALNLIQKHLMPMDLPDDILLMQEPMLEEADDDLESIQKYLEANNLSDADEHIEEAIQALQQELYVTQDKDDWHRLTEAQQEHLRIRDYWHIDFATNTPTHLGQLINALPDAENETEAALEGWLKAAHQTLTEHATAKTWYEELDDIAPYSEFHATVLNQYTPVFLDSEPTILNLLEDHHQYMMMGGGDEEGTLSLSWDTSPEILLNWCDKVNAGRTLITRLFTATQEATE